MPLDAVSSYSNNAALFNYALGKTKDNAPVGNKKDDANPPEEQDKVKELTKRDQEVRSHEAAHISAGGQYVKGAATFTYQKGPDGKMYAVGGEVSIDTSPVKGDPQATIAKMQAIKRAALAPSEPSGQDRSVASEASQAETNARQEIAKKTQGGGSEKTGESGKAGSAKKSSYNEKGLAMSAEIQKSLINISA